MYSSYGGFIPVFNLIVVYLCIADTVYMTMLSHTLQPLDPEVPGNE